MWYEIFSDISTPHFFLSRPLELPADDAIKPSDILSVVECGSFTPENFSFSQTFTRVSIALWKHGKCFLFLMNTLHDWVMEDYCCFYLPFYQYRHVEVAQSEHWWQQCNSVGLRMLHVQPLNRLIYKIIVNDYLWGYSY